jgi:hypothetical protein
MTILNANKMNTYISIIFSVCITSLSYAQADIKKPKDKEKKQPDSLAIQAPCNHGDTLDKMYKSILQIQAHQDSIYSFKTKNAQLTDDNNRLTQEKATLSNDNKTLTTKVASLESVITTLENEKKRAETTTTTLQTGLSNQINTFGNSLKYANYTTNTGIINSLTELAKMSSNVLAVSQLEEFKVKSSAIQLAMNEINSSKIFTESQVKTIQTNLESAYGVNNPNFMQLANDYKQCLELLSKYGTNLCDLYYAFNTVVVDLKAGSQEMKEDVIKNYALQMRNYPTFVNLVQEIINKKFVSNPLEGKVNCD